MRRKRKRKQEEETTKEETTEQKEFEALTEEDVQKRIASLMHFCDMYQGRMTDAGMQVLNANLKLIESYVEIARIKADVIEANIYLEIEKMRQD